MAARPELWLLAMFRQGNRSDPRPPSSSAQRSLLS